MQLVDKSPSEIPGVFIPPHSTLAEQSVIGSLLIDSNCWLKVQGILQETFFYAREHRFIYRAIRRLSEDSSSIDVLTVSDFLEKQKVLEECGGLAYLGMLARDTPSSANVVSYAKIVQDRAVRRHLITLARSIEHSAFNDAEHSASDLISHAEELIFKLRQQQSKGSDGFVKLKDALKDVVDTIEQNFENPPESGVNGVTSGFPEVDELLSGFDPGLYIVAGRPSMGKTSLAMNFAENAALSGVPVAVFSLEMPTEQLGQRMLAGSSGLPVRLMRDSWDIRDDGWAKINAGLQRISDIPLWIDDNGQQSISSIRSNLMRLNADINRDYPKGVGLIVIDYLQLMGSDSDSNGNANERITIISRGLKLLSKEFNAPVIVLSQLNRKVEERGNKRPLNSDLRDSGAIEQDADVIMFVYRDEVYNTDTPDKGVAEVIVSKQRNGPLGTVRLMFEGFSTRFRSFL